MAHLKMIGATMVALFAIGLEAKVEKSLWTFWQVGNKLSEVMSERLSAEDQANAEKAFSFAKQLVGGLTESEAIVGAELLSAWDQVLHRPDLCNELSLGYIATIASCRPNLSESTRSLTEATQRYASRCLTPDYITNKIDSETRGSGCFSISCSKIKDVKFIDAQLIADYWSENPGDRRLMFIEGPKAARALAKAVLRDPKRNIKDTQNRNDVHAYLDSRMYKPCSKLRQAIRDVMREIYFASDFSDGGYDKLVSSLDQNTQSVFFRFRLCTDLGMRSNEVGISNQVVSELKSLDAS